VPTELLTGGRSVRVDVETPILSSVVAGNIPEEEKVQLMRAVRGLFLSRQSLRRQGMPDDVAEAGVSFSSDRSSYIIGTVLAVDGGMGAGNPATSCSFEEADHGSR
jgi:NAD(P)-dependent dehydrogenase (short-subunit alcohol dehydrogenase family)